MYIESVKKFGGTSMAHPEVVAGILAEQTGPQLIVVSAPGKDQDNDVKMTDLLIEYGICIDHGNDRAASEIEDQVIDRFEGLYSSLGNKALGGIKKTISSSMHAYEAVGNSAYFPSLGETISAECLGQLVGAKVLEPSIVFRQGKLDRDATKQAIASTGDMLRLIGDNKFIVPGFYGYEKRASGFKRRELLGRGGSDRTGALWAAALGVPYENWTDVDGVMSADPRIVPNAHVIPELTRPEARGGALGGSGVLQSDIFIDLSGSDVTTIVRNTFNTNALGTRVQVAREIDGQNPVVATSGKNIWTLNVEDLGMAEKKGYIAQLTMLASKNDIGIDLMPTGNDEVTLTFEDHVPIEKIEKLADKWRKISPAAEVTLRNDRAIAHIVGEALRSPSVVPSVLAKACRVLEKNNIPLHTVISNPGSPRLAVMVDSADLPAAIRQLHGALIENS